MSLEYKVKRITRLHESCNICGLPIINCICGIVPRIQTNAKIWILSTEREFYRPSNTARLLKLANPDSTEIILWERTNIPEKLLENIDSGVYEVYLLFPVEDEEGAVRKVEYNNSGKPPAFIIIDGTWKEARKILRKSDYLKRIPIISLEPTFKSKYDLRRGASEENLCTIEAAIEVLKINGELRDAEAIEGVFDLFLKSFKAGATGQKLKQDLNSDGDSFTPSEF